MAKITVQICGEEQALCDAMRAMLGGHPDIQTSTQVRRGDQAAPAHPAVQFDVQIVLLGAHPEDTLRVLAALPASQRSAMIVVGHDSDVKLMRQAMQAGARDYFAPPVMRAELIERTRQQLSQSLKVQSEDVEKLMQLFVGQLRRKELAEA